MVIKFFLIASLATLSWGFTPTANDCVLFWEGCYSAAMGGHSHASSKPTTTECTTKYHECRRAVQKPVQKTSDTLDDLIKNNRIIVFSATYCGWCTKAKDLLKSLGEKFEVVETDSGDNRSKYWKALTERTGKNTVPQIFINGQFVGGYNEQMIKQRLGKQ